MEIIYTFIIKPSTYTGTLINALPLFIQYVVFLINKIFNLFLADYENFEKALPAVIRYFLSWKDKLVAEILTNKDDDIQKLRLLANYQIILNRLMSIQKKDLLHIGDLENVFFGEYESIFAFLRLNTLALEGNFSNLTNSHALYLSVISNFELINTFFFKDEIHYVLKMYYDYWKFASSKSRCATQTEKGIQNLVNANLLIDGERIQLSGLPFSSHRLWKIMNVKQKRDYNVEFALHKRLSDSSIFSILKYNSMHLFLNQKDAFLLKDNEIEAKLVSDDFKLCHRNLGFRVALNGTMVGSDDNVIAFQTDSYNPGTKVYLFDSDGFEYGEIYGGNTLILKNSSKFVGKLSSPLPCSFYINSFCSFSSKSQSLLDALLTRGVLFNFALDSYIFTLESQAQSFYLFNSYDGPAKDFYAMKEGRHEYFVVIKGEKFKIHSPAGIEENFFASSNLPFLFLSVEKSSQIIIPVIVLEPKDSYKFTFLKAT
ncbi:hypothetical protein DI09_316p10, partial [Mitosporidium daphniae]